jgi:hypothetical protein
LISSSRINTGKFLSQLCWFALAVLCIAVLVQLKDATAMASSGVIVPLYSYPGPTWNALIEEKNAHKSVPIVAIINPDSGPGTEDPNYSTNVQNLQAAGITVLGYVSTNYGAKSMPTVESEIDSYHNWYHVNGTFFDQMSNVPGNETYYGNLTKYVKSHDMSMTIGNPGIDTLPSYVGTVDNIVVYDNPGLPSISSLGGWHENFTETNFSLISYSASNINSTYVENATRYVQYLYITNSTLPNPFLTLPSYFDDLLKMLENVNEQNNITPAITAKTSLYGEQENGTLEIDLMAVDGNPADYHGTALKIYQDNNNIPFETINSIPESQYNISLPLEHRYKIELYASGMLACTDYANLLGDQKLKMAIPDPGSALFFFVYNDGFTPINNATVMLKSTDGAYEYWTNSTTDNSGGTIKYWLQPTTNDNYYVATIIIDNNISYSYSPIGIQSGRLTSTQIVTPWPTYLDPITVSLYKTPFQKVSRSDGDFAVQLYHNGNKVAESKVNLAGQAYFASLKVGRYAFHVINLNDPSDPEWNPVNMTLDGKKTSVQLFENTNQTDNANTNDPATQDNMTAASDTSVPQNQIPIWIKNNAKWWAQNQVSDSDFVSGIQYLIDEGIMKIPTTITKSDSSSEQIPSWIKSNAGWWAQGQISDNDFIKGIQYLISNGVIKISSM